MLRDRRLLQPQRDHDLPHLALVRRQVVQNLAPPWLGHRVERIRSCRRPRHGSNNIFLYGYMSSSSFLCLAGLSTYCFAFLSDFCGLGWNAIGGLASWMITAA